MGDQDVSKTVGKALLDVPIAEMITSLGLGIAEAQRTLDSKMLKVAQMMSGEWEDEKGNKKSSLVRFDGEELSLMELGFMPTFYQFTETSIEIKVSISMSSTIEQSSTTTTVEAEAEASMGFMGASASMNLTSVSASYSSKYQYSAEGSSVVHTKLVPVPPPALLEERIRRAIDKRYKK